MKEKKRLSVIWIIQNYEEKNAATWAALEQQTLSRDDIQLLLCPETEEAAEDASVRKAQAAFDAVWVEAAGHKGVRLNRAAPLVTGDFVTEVESGDRFPQNYLSVMLEEMERAYHQEGIVLGMTRKHGPEEENDDLASRLPRGMSGDVVHVDFQQVFDCAPYFLPGTWLRGDYVRTHRFHEDWKLEFEKEYLLRADLEAGRMVFANHLLYEYDEAREGDFVYFSGHYEKEWYLEVFETFWLPFLAELEETCGRVPDLIQYQLLYTLKNRMETNLNNRDKRCILPEEAEDYLWSWGKLLKYADDENIMNGKQQRICTNNSSFKLLFLRLKKHDPKLRYELKKQDGALWFCYAGIGAARQAYQGVNIQYMEYTDGELLIEGTMSSLYDLEKGRLYVTNGKKVCEMHWNQRYAHTKVFGFAYTKRYPFEVRVPISQRENHQEIAFCFEQGRVKCRVPMTFSSHTSRLTKMYRMSHWNFGEHFMAYHKEQMICIDRVGAPRKVLTELMLWINMLVAKNTRRYQTYHIVGQRILYFLLKPFWGRKPVWFFIDKIYKAGDSSEYLYRYACGKNDGIQKYYLVDKNAPDCARLRAEGFEPLVRGTLKHRMMFLYADMMVISNSTVFAFNDYTLGGSAVIRDLVHFHVACVQHGMSVQKIAIAQNRLRDNIRLYFCASRYELDNLNHPVYDYVGRDILKLTGVPRYDGLVNHDKRQLLITPTWRMQAAMPVRQNESVQRDYNPLFKETAYFRIYNSLINDPRLLAAAKEYGYRIHYVLHPIVSPQAEDFDKNDYVDIIPSTGDMSYEKEFQESSLMVSDFSGVQFDFAYMRKPVVYLHHDDIPQHYEEGTFHYDTMAFGEICHNNEELIDVLIDYMRNDCQMKPEYRRRADDFFYYDDHNNCQRIYDVMLDYYKTKVAPVYHK